MAAQARAGPDAVCRMPWKPVPTATGAWWLPQNVTADRYYFDLQFAKSIVYLARRQGYLSMYNRRKRNRVTRSRRSDGRLCPL